MNLMKLVCWRDSGLGPQKEDFVGLETKTLHFFGIFCWGTFFGILLVWGGCVPNFVFHVPFEVSFDIKRIWIKSFS